ncbi:hypothetical protein ONS95_001300 [Cadophora gregata]|uniref:uncharacterized protein n=1 Tax=Cadophora gregata TaxID=51156 RepID=UPI0026DBC2E9|nr:uncharacterized protein ONS95_001300 [Cadophora gregata]KAK0101888.1 hypothetical protein ONS96_005863 [Cadophora gregata f. sp. sojae]KAK0129374.1 hypothetical protein ONS95_001300 [Cadophora gregata]
MVRQNPSKGSKALSSVFTTSASTKDQSDEQTTRIQDSPVKTDSPTSKVTSNGRPNKELPIPRGNATHFSGVSRVSHGRMTRTGWVALTEFNLFPKLPLELRRMIWNTALSHPQILGIPSATSANFVPAKKYNSIRNVCKEARAEALKVQTLSCFNDIKCGVSGIYSNNSVDILWILSGSDDEPGCLEGLWDSGPKLGRIALPASEWYRHLMYKDIYKSLFSFLAQKGVEEIFVIVGPEDGRLCADKVFTEPCGSPHTGLPQHIIDWLAANMDLKGLAEGTASWAELSECETKSHRDFQEEVHKEILELAENLAGLDDYDKLLALLGLIPSGHVITPDMLDLTGSGSTIRKITFVEVKDASVLRNDRRQIHRSHY